MKYLFLFLTTLISSAALASGQMKASVSCLAIMKSQDPPELVRIYARKGAIIPQALECDHCGDISLMPATLESSRFVTDTQSDGQSSASIECEGCGAPNEIWRVTQTPTHIRISGRAKFFLPDIKHDPEAGKRYVELPPEYKDLADRHSALNKMARSQQMHICSNCSTSAFVPANPIWEELDCPNCGKQFSPNDVYNTGKLLAAFKQGEPVIQKKPTPKGTRPNPPRAQPTQQPIQQEALAPRPAPSSQVTDIHVQARDSLNRYFTRWVGGGVIAAAVASTGAYIVTNDHVVAMGEIVSIDELNVATVEFQEVPYYADDPSLMSYTAQVMLDEKNGLPGDVNFVSEVGDVVSIHYRWADYHYLSFVFHPFSGAEFEDGSIVGGEDISK